MGSEDGKKRRDGVEITALGAFAKGAWAKKYWSSSRGKDRYPYPVGYQAVRCYGGHNYYMEICEGKRGPLFRVTCEEGKACSGETPNSVWEDMLRKKHVGAKKPQGRPLTSGINGSEMFGFMDPVVQLLLRELIAAENGLANTSSSVCLGADTCTNLVGNNIPRHSNSSIPIQVHSVMGQLVGSASCAVSPAAKIEECIGLARNCFSNDEAKDKIGQMENIADANLGSNHHSEQEPMKEHLITLQPVVAAVETVDGSLPMDGSVLSFPVKTGHDPLARACREDESHLEDHNFKKRSSQKVLQEDESRKLVEFESCMQLKAPSIPKQVTVEAAKLKQRSDDNAEHPTGPGNFLISSGPVSQECTQHVSSLEVSIGLARNIIPNEAARGESDQPENSAEAHSGSRKCPENETAKEKQITISQPAVSAVNMVEDIFPMEERLPSSPVINPGAFQNGHDPLTSRPCIEQELLLENNDEQEHHSRNVMQEFDSSELIGINNCIQIEASSLPIQDSREAAILPSVMADITAEHLVIEGRLNKLGVATVLSPTCEIDLSSDTVPEERDVSERDDEFNASVEEVSMIFSSENQSQKTESESMGQELTTSMVAILLPQAMPLLRKKSTKRRKKRNKPSVEETCHGNHTTTSQNIGDAPESGMGVPVSCPATYQSTREPCHTISTAICQSEGKFNQNLYLDKDQTSRSEKDNLPVLHAVDGTAEYPNSLASASASSMKPIINSNTVLLPTDNGNQTSKGDMRLHAFNEFGDSQTKQTRNCNKNNNLLLDMTFDHNFWKDTGNFVYEDSCSLFDKNLATSSIGTDNLPRNVSTQEAFHGTCQDKGLEVLNLDCLKDDRKHAEDDFFANDELVGDILDYEGLPSFHKEFVHPHLLEPVVCLAHPMPVLAMCINVRGENIRLCVCCGIVDQQERHLFLYDVVADLEAKITLLSVIVANLSTGLDISSTSYRVMEECGIRFTPNGQEIILLGCFQVTKERINFEHIQRSMLSNHVHTSNIVNIFSFATGKARLEVSLEAEKQLQCLSIPSARILVAAGDQGYICCWRMKCNWRSFEEKFCLPNAQFKGVLLGNIMRLLAVPSLPNLVLGCDSGGSFAVWDWKKRVLLLSFQTNEFCFPKVYILDKFLLAQCGEYPAPGFCSEENMVKNGSNWSYSTLSVGDCPCQKLSEHSSSGKGNRDRACKKLPQGSLSIPYFLLVVKAELQEAMAEKSTMKDFGNHELSCKCEMGSWKPAALVNQTVVTGISLDNRASVVTVMGRYGVAGITNGKVYLWDILSGRRVIELLELEGSTITCMTAHQASASLAVAGKDGRVVLYLCMPTGEKVSVNNKLQGSC